MARATRRLLIAERIERDGAAAIGELAAELSVSEMTIRRDLDALAAEGRAIRTYGGATAAGRISFEFAFLERTREHAEEKLFIAEQAAGLVRDGQSILLDSGTTTLAVARALRGRRGITVITTSLPIASELQFHSEISVLLLGGFLRRSSPDLSGGLTERNLEALRADVAFLGADAVDLDGTVYNESVDCAALLVRMARSAGSVYVVADHGKLGRHGLMQFGKLSEWKGLITDGGAAREAVESLEAAGVSVIGVSS